MAAYTFVGDEPRRFPWGTVRPGDIACFHVYPGQDWREVEPEPASTQVAAEMKRPGKAASAEDWKAYALAHGGFQEATGTHPDDATRRAIVEHYTGDGGDGE